MVVEVSAGDEGLGLVLCRIARIGVIPRPFLFFLKSNAYSGCDRKRPFNVIAAANYWRFEVEFGRFISCFFLYQNTE